MCMENLKKILSDNPYCNVENHLIQNMWIITYLELSGYFRSGRYVVTSQFENYIGLLMAYLFEDIAIIFLAMFTALLPPHLMSGVLITGRLLKSDQHISLPTLLFALR